jgi:hypothetical protein
MTIELNDDDVVSLARYLSLIETETFKAGQLKRGVQDRLRNAITDQSRKFVDDWFGHGVPCETLKANGGDGWKKGKVRIRLEFVPDKPEPTSSEWLRKIIKSQQQQ